MKRTMNIIEDAKKINEEYTDPERGTVHIGFPSTLATYMMPTAISAFRKQYPEVEFDLHQQSYVNLSESVMKGDVNIALIDPVPQSDDKIESTILFTENIFAFFPVIHYIDSHDFFFI